MGAPERRVIGVEYSYCRKDKMMNEPWDFEVMADAIRDALEHEYKIEKKDTKGDVPWTGPELTANSLLVGCPGNQELLKRESLEYGEDDQGRDPLDVIIGIAIRLGMDQLERHIHQPGGLKCDE